MERWTGKVAVVTGASAGIGYAIVEKLVQNGLKVVGLARRQERLDEMEEKFRGQKGEFFGRKTDCSDKDDILAAYKWITENVGPLSVLVNNAGVAAKGQITDGDLDKWKQMIDTNLYGLAVSTSTALKIMKEHYIDDGHIFNINSIAGHKILYLPQQNLYAATKHGVTATTEIVRRELANRQSKIRVTSISPGLVDTEIFEANQMVDETTKKILQVSPHLNSEDVADALIYALGAPSHVQITELTIQPTGEIF